MKPHDEPPCVTGGAAVLWLRAYVVRVFPFKDWSVHMSRYGYYEEDDGHESERKVSYWVTRAQSAPTLKFPGNRKTTVLAYQVTSEAVTEDDDCRHVASRVIAWTASSDIATHIAHALNSLGTEESK